MTTTGTEEEAVRFLARHFVSLTWQDRTPEARGGPAGPLGRHVAASGTVIAVRGEWFLLTAGHILADVAKARELGQVLEQWRLDDSWSWRAKRRVGSVPDSLPFDYDDAPKVCIYDEDLGVDYGLVRIEPFLTEGLRAHGIEPIDESSWRAEWPSTFDGYLLMGIPTQLVEDLSGGALVQKDLLAVGVRRDDEPPEILRKPYPRWYGRIIPEMPMEVLGKRFDNVDGMSGGPLFGVKKMPDGSGRYWILGVQSGWVAEEKAIAVCPLQEFVWLLDERLSRIPELSG